MRLIPQAVGPYRVLEALGDGGAGLVLRGAHRESGALVALKIPKLDSLEQQVALRREIGVLKLLSRTGIRGVVRILEEGSDSTPPWYAMEVLPGRSLGHWQSTLWQGLPNLRNTAGAEYTLEISAFSDRSPVTQNERATFQPPLAIQPCTERHPVAAGQLARNLRMLLRIADTITQLHAEGIVHGDITPSNVLFRDEDDPVLIDFGAALVNAPSAPCREAPLSAILVRGTPGYIAPESIRGGGLDARTDLYSLGCIMYGLLAGRPPFVASRAEDILRQQSSASPRPISQWVEGLPSDLEQIIHGLLEPDPLKRVAHADEVCRVLRDHVQAAPPPSRTQGNNFMLYRSQLQGRREERTLLESRIEQTLNGRGGLVLVLGAPGAGRSRLLREVGWDAASKGGLVIAGQPRMALPLGTSGAIPGSALDLFASTIQHLTSATDASEPEPDTRADQEDLRALLRPPTSGQDDKSFDRAPATTDKGAALRSLFSLLARASAHRPTVILLDDAHRADELSLAFLVRYARDFASTQVLIVASLSDGPALAKTGLLEAADLCMQLSALDAGDTRSMVKGVLGTGTLPDGLFEFVQRHANGNPFLIAEHTRAAMSRGLLQRKDGHWVFGAPRGVSFMDLELPESIEDLFDLRISQLSTPARQAFLSACVLRHDFDASAFEHIASTAGSTHEVLEELVAREVVRPNAHGHYRFVDDRLVESLERRMTASQRQTQHRKAATYLENATTQSQDYRKAALGYHWALAGESRRALDYLESAAQDACSGHALERSVELFRLAVEHCSNVEPSPIRDERLNRLHEQLAEVLIKRSQHREAWEHLTHVLDNLPASEGLQRARLQRKLAASYCTVHDYERAAKSSTQAECEIASVSGEQSAAYWSELIQIRLGRFDQLYFSGKRGPVLDALVDELAPLIQSYGSAEQASSYYFMATSHAFLRSRYAFDPRALDLAERGHLSAQAGGHRTGLAQFILGGALLMGSREQCRLATQHFEHARIHALRTGDNTLLSRVLAYKAIGHLRLGDVDTTAATAHSALEAAEVAGLSPYIASAQACRGWVAWKHGNSAEASTLLQSARARWKALPHKFPFSNLAIFPLLDMACNSDEFEVATTLLGELAEGLPALPECLAKAVDQALEAIQRSDPRAAASALNQVLMSALQAALF